MKYVLEVFLWIISYPEKRLRSFTSKGRTFFLSSSPIIFPAPFHPEFKKRTILFLTEFQVI